MRWTRALVLVTLLAVVSACGGQPAGADGDADGGDGATPAAQEGGGGGNGDGGGAAGLAELEEQLEPPNAQETSRVEVAGGTSIT